MKRLSLISMVICTAALLTACETMDGLKRDFSNIQMPEFTATSPSGTSSEALIAEGNCPKTQIVDDLRTLSDFVNPAVPQESELISRGTITGFETGCTFNEKSMVVDLRLSFANMLGPQAHHRGNAQDFSYPFFIAVVSPTGDILAKEVFSIAIPADDVHHESMRQVIPVQDKALSSRYKIMAGFQLTAEQLAYNRHMIKMRAQEEAMRAERERQMQAQIEAAQSNPDAISIQRLPDNAPLNIVPAQPETTETK